MMKFNLDERNKEVIMKVCTVMYLLTFVMLAIALLYRQFVLRQPIDDYSDIANIFTFNTLVLLAAILYLGGIQFPPLKLSTVLILYLGFVTIGFLYTFFKYTILLESPISFGFMLEKLGIILVICALILGIYVLFAFLGRRKMERDLS